MNRMTAVLASALLIVVLPACDSAKESGTFPVEKQQPDQGRVDTTSRDVILAPYEGRLSGKAVSASKTSNNKQLKEIAFVAKLNPDDDRTGAVSSDLAGATLTVVYNTGGLDRNGGATTMDVSTPARPRLIADYKPRARIEFSDVAVVDGKVNLVGQVDVDEVDWAGFRLETGAFFMNVEDQVLLDLPSSTGMGVDFSSGLLAVVTGHEGTLSFISDEHSSSQVVEEATAFLGLDVTDWGVAVTDAEGSIRLYRLDGGAKGRLSLPGPLNPNERAEVNHLLFNKMSYFGVGAHSHGAIVLDDSGRNVLTVPGFALGVDLDENGIAFALDGKVVYGEGNPEAGYTLYQLVDFPYANSVLLDGSILYVSSHDGTHVLSFE